MNRGIKRFCELVSEINNKNKELDDARNKFHDGGYSFEEVYESDIAELEKLEKDFESIFRTFSYSFTNGFPNPYN
jgi:exonuclease VII small subunit